MNAVNEVTEPKETITGLAAEVVNVADRIMREAADRGATGVQRRTQTILMVRKLHRLATRLHHFYETACNREMTPGEERLERATEARVLMLCHLMGVRVEFQSDPRGAPIQIPSSRSNANYASGCHIAIPFGPARDYKDSRAEV